MANKKISELAEMSAPSLNDLLAIVDDSGGTSNKITLQTLLTYINDNYDWSGEYVYFVGKHGSDSNDGDSFGKAFLTFGAAVSAINSVSPAPDADNHYSIVCLDGAEYEEDIELPDGANLYAPNADIKGTITQATSDQYNNIAVRKIQPSSDNNAIEIKDGITLFAKNISTTGSGISIVQESDSSLHGKVNKIYSQKTAIQVTEAEHIFETDEIYIESLSNVLKALEFKGTEEEDCIHRSQRIFGDKIVGTDFELIKLADYGGKSSVAIVIVGHLEETASG